MVELLLIAIGAVLAKRPIDWPRCWNPLVRRTVTTADALHAQREHAAFLVEGKKAH